MRSERRPISCRTRDDDLDGPLVVVSTMPLRTQRNDRVVHIRTDAPRHAYDHRLTCQRTSTRFPVHYHVGGDLLDPLRRTNDRLDSSPTRLQLFPQLDLSEF